MIKYQFLLFLIIGVLATAKGQVINENPESLKFKNDFETVSSIYIENAKSYFENLCEKQLEPLPANSPKDLIKVRKLLLKSRVENLESRAISLKAEILKNFQNEINQRNIVPTREKIASIFQSVYEFEFPGLDYSYFKKINEKIKSI